MKIFQQNAKIQTLFSTVLSSQVNQPHTNHKSEMFLSTQMNHQVNNFLTQFLLVTPALFVPALMSMNHSVKNKSMLLLVKSRGY